MAITSATSTTGTTSSTTSVVALPSTAAAGDLAIVLMGLDIAAGTSTNGGGFTNLKDEGLTDVWALVAYKKCVGGETSVTFTHVSERTNAICYLIPAAEWHGTTVPEITAVADGASTANPDPPSITPSWGAEAGTLICAVLVADDSATPFPVTAFPTNYATAQAQLGTVISAGSVAGAWRTVNAVSEDPGTFTMTVAEHTRSYTLAVRGPVVTGPQTLTPGLINQAGVVFSPTVTTTYSITPGLINQAGVVYAPSVAIGPITLGPALINDAGVVYAPVVTRGAVTITPGLISNAGSVFAPVVTVGAKTLTPALISQTAVAFAPVVTLTLQVITPGLINQAGTVFGPTVGLGTPPSSPGSAGIPNPRLVVAYYTNNGSTFGPGVANGIIHDASEVGWSWYSRYPSNAFFTLPQNSVHNSRLVPLLTHIQVWYVNDATGTVKLVFTGRLGDPDSTTDDVVWTAWNYLSDLSLSRTGYRTLYPTKLIGTEIASPEWVLAKGATFSLLSHVATGTIENPLGSDAVTPIKTDQRFGVIDVPRLLLMFDLTEIGRANTVNNVTFEITREPPFTFNFWKNRGTALVGRRLTFPGVIRDYQFVPGYQTMRNDLATIGTTLGGGAVEIIKTDETSAGTYGRRQDVFTIKTLSGLAGAATESDAQQAITDRAVKEATQLSRSISLDIRNDLFEPFTGWELEDTIPVQIIRGRDAIDATYRIIGAKGLMNASGYHPSVIVQLPTAA